jgi:hypothetical protein
MHVKESTAAPVIDVTIGSALTPPPSDASGRTLDRRFGGSSGWV